MIDPRQERRIPPQPLTEDRVAVMIEEAVDDAMSKHEQRITTMFKAEFGQLHTLISAAFPNGDVHGHKIAHEKAIKDANRWDQLKSEFISKAFTTGMMGAVAFLLMAAWEAVKGEVKK